MQQPGLQPHTLLPSREPFAPDASADAAAPSAAHTGQRTALYGQQTAVYGQFGLLGGQTLPRLPDRPARVQVEQRRKLQQAEHLGEYNIWYHRYAGESGYERAARASTRVCLETDAGLTRADYTNPSAVICLHFARGCCIYGADCVYRHCAPNTDDETATDAPHDVFGRDRHGSFRDDMGGVGTWNKECKTLYVGRVCATPPEAQMLETVARHFGEFGVVESARVLRSKGCAFVTYTLRCSAEFAKEAMAEQQLDHDEQINVRWAYDDPNPRAQAMRLRNHAQIMLAAMEAKGDLDCVEGYAEAVMAAAAKRQRVAGGGGGDGGAEVAPADPPVEHTPMTRQQFERQEEERERVRAELAAEEEGRQRQAETEERASRLDTILQGIDDAGAGAAVAAEPDANEDPLQSFLREVNGGEEETATAGTQRSEGRDLTTASEMEGGAGLVPAVEIVEMEGGVEHMPAVKMAGGAGLDPAAEMQGAGAADVGTELPPGVFQPRLPPGWQEYVDPSSGHPYYVRSETGESTWRRPIHTS